MEKGTADSILGMFTATDREGRPWFESPYDGKDGYVYACDGRAFIRIPYALLPEKDGVAEKPFYVIREGQLGERCSLFIPREALQAAMRQCQGDPEGLCPECHGRCRVDVDYYDRNGDWHRLEAECPACGGEGILSGRVSYDGFYVDGGAPLVAIGDVLFCATDLAKAGNVADLLGEDGLHAVRCPLSRNDKTRCLLFEYGGGIQVGMIPAVVLTERSYHRVELLSKR